MSKITTHVLDTARGRGASEVEVILAYDVGSGQEWRELTRGKTDENGRIANLSGAHLLAPGVYRLRFQLEAYFERSGFESFYPYADVIFRIRDASEHYHVPLLVSAHGYTTYRGT